MKTSASPNDGRMALTKGRMMMNGKIFGVMLAAVLLSGCGAVMEKPLPVTPLSTAENMRLEGAWVGADGKHDYVVNVHVTCDGVAHIASTGWDHGRFQTVQTELLFSRGGVEGGQRFVSMRMTGANTKPTKKAEYQILKYRFLSANTLVFWLPRVDAFADAIKSGHLKGRSTRFENDITSPPQDVLDYLVLTHGDRLFEFQNPAVFHKVAQAGEGVREDCKKK